MKLTVKHELCPHCLNSAGNQLVRDIQNQIDASLTKPEGMAPEERALVIRVLGAIERYLHAKATK